jgi:glycosyltransferase involved in cell wall biosynthesis
MIDPIDPTIGAKSSQSELENMLVSIVIPAYNEEALVEAHLSEIYAYLSVPQRDFNWELLIVNDGSTDRTGVLADKFAENYDNVRVLHHPVNFGLGQALKFGFANTNGDYVITMDIDLSYAPYHIDLLVDCILQTKAKIVLASPYMKGGQIKNVPKRRMILSILGNRFLRIFVRGNYSTLTSMMRIYDGAFIRSLDLRAMGMDVMPETIFKAMVLHARVVEVPGKLDWGPQSAYVETRTSSMRLMRHVFSTVLSGFIFRPFVFLVIPGMLIGIFSIYVNFWMVVHFFGAVAELAAADQAYSFSEAFANAYRQFPHTFIVGFLSAMLSIQLVGLGLLALQSKKYFEELFHLGSTRLRDIRQRVK